MLTFSLLNRGTFQTCIANGVFMVFILFCQGANGKRAYIASQGPLPHTVHDFWRMLWEYKIEVVVMVCQEFEVGKVSTTSLKILKLILN